MRNRALWFGLPLVAAALWVEPAASAITVDWVPVWAAGNAADTSPVNCGFGPASSCGDVAYPYRISKTEVTNAQYAAFLNAVADADPTQLYSTSMSSSFSSFGGIDRSGSAGSYSYSVVAGRGDKPVNYVSFYDALRFANWLHNGQPTGAQGSSTTEGGAYTLLGGTPTPSNGLTVTRNPGARVFLTSQDEWYKAAYYDAATTGYFDYPTGTDDQPTCASPGATPNTANCTPVGLGTDVTDVGGYTGSPSPSGTFDQGGNVDEWNEAIVNVGTWRDFRGGSLDEPAGALAASQVAGGLPTIHDRAVGFRVASTFSASTTWVTVRAPGNGSDTQGYGAVAYPYLISKTEVTNAQYAAFLNAVADADPTQLYDTNMSGSFSGIDRSGSAGSYSYSVQAGRGNRPVNYVSFYDALRYANWLHNGQPTGAQGSSTTEDGAYTLLGGTPTPSNGLTVTRNPGARVFLTSQDEWYKAAYYDAATTSYFDYPTGTDDQPTCASPGATPNTANCTPVGLGTDVTDVGGYTGSPSPSGTFDQGGNVEEWNEAIVNAGAWRDFRGGSLDESAGTLAASSVAGGLPTIQDRAVGFRIASRVACRDGLDNDGDGLVDHGADPGCASVDDESELSIVINVPGSPPFNSCDDGVDNDGDTLVDYGSDPGCAWPASYTENPECSDGLDNDFDGLIDHPADPECVKPWDVREGVAGPQCGLGYELGVVLPLLWYLRERRRRRA